MASSGDFPTSHMWFSMDIYICIFIYIYILLDLSYHIPIKSHWIYHLQHFRGQIGTDSQLCLVLASQRRCCFVIGSRQTWFWDFDVSLQLFELLLIWAWVEMLIACIRPAVPLNPTNVVETRTNQPYFNGLYNLFMVKLGMVYFCLTHIIPSMTITNQRIYMDLYGFLLFCSPLKIP